MSRNLARVELEYPIRSNGRTISELKIRAPTPADAAMVGFNPESRSVETAIRLVAHLASVRPRTIEELAPSDFARLMDAVMASGPVSGNA